MGKKEIEEMQVVMKRFGDEQSTLLDKFERRAFEVQLNQAILGRSVSEPRVQRYHMSPILSPLESKVTQGRGHRFQKMLKKLFKPIFGTNKEERKEIITSYQKNFEFMKASSRSLRA